MKKVVITGANGFIGSALVRELVANEIEVVALDRDGCYGNLPQSPLVKFIPFDLSDISKVTATLKERKLDTYFHLAWFGMNGATRGDAEIQLKNAEWTLNALKQAEIIGCKRFVCAGSIMEYETIAAVLKQGNHPASAYVYGAAKFAARSLCMIEAQRSNIEVVWAEITNAYGVGENSPRLINSTIKKILLNQPLEFTSGTQNYDFVYIDDTARALRLIGANGKPFCHYLIGSSRPRPLKEFLMEMQKTLAPEKDFMFGNVPFTGVSLSLEELDASLTESDTGFRAEISFAEGITRTMEWIKAQNKK